MSTTTITYPAFAADTLGETVTLTLPAGWHAYVAAIAHTFPYGPQHSRAALELAQDASRCVRQDYSAVGWDHLVSALNRVLGRAAAAELLEAQALQA